MAKELIMTEERFKELQARLDYLKNQGRKEVAEQIKIARDFGDLSENAEYDAAKNKQAEIEDEIINIDYQITHAKVLSRDNLDTSKVSIGCKVKILDVEFDDVDEYMLVGTAEAMSSEDKISNESPLGKALIGHGIGEIVNVSTPQGIVEYKILDISL